MLVYTCARMQVGAVIADQLMLQLDRSSVTEQRLTSMLAMERAQTRPGKAMGEMYATSTAALNNTSHWLQAQQQVGTCGDYVRVGRWGGGCTPRARKPSTTHPNGCVETRRAPAVR